MLEISNFTERDIENLIEFWKENYKEIRKFNKELDNLMYNLKINYTFDKSRFLYLLKEMKNEELNKKEG